jgi:hypothetical protein
VLGDFKILDESGQFVEPIVRVKMRDGFTKSVKRRTHMGTEGRLASVDTQEPIGSKGLHETLRSTLPKDSLKLLTHLGTTLAKDRFVVVEKMQSLPGADLDIRIAEK